VYNPEQEIPREEESESKPLSG
jgi:hypothetical protein